jgi:hypothetical protein
LRFPLRMDPSDINKELEAISARKAALRAEQEKMEELERAFALVSQHLSGKKESPASQFVRPSNPTIRRITRQQEPVFSEFSGNGSKASNIKAALNEMPDQFTVSDVFDAIIQKGIVGLTKNDVSFALSRMKKAGKLHVLQQGAGKTPSIYSKTKALPRSTGGDPLFS